MGGKGEKGIKRFPKNLRASFYFSDLVQVRQDLTKEDSVILDLLCTSELRRGDGRTSRARLGNLKGDAEHGKEHGRGEGDAADYPAEDGGGDGDLQNTFAGKS
jgi:hypothetical protein